MKRKQSALDKEEANLSSLLFDNNKKFVKKLETGESNKEISDRRPVWNDEDDEQVRVNTVIPKVTNDGLYAEKLKQKYETLIGTPGWAKITDKKEDKGLDSDVLRTVGHLEKKKLTKFDKKLLEIKKTMKIVTKPKTVITCVEFHPKVSAVLHGGHSGVMTLNSIGSEINKLHSFKLKGWKISNGKFDPDGSLAYISSSTKHDYCIYDVVKASTRLVQLPKLVKHPKIFQLSPDGKFIATTDGFDEVYVICAKSNELLKSVKNNTNVKSLVFGPDSKQIYCFNEEGIVIVWDLSTFRAVKKFYDSGCVTPARIKLSPCGRLLATGTGEGIVNVYETSNITSNNPIPLKTISNLQTKITNLNFNSTSEILSLASSFHPNALKLIHIPSYHVFANFPTMNLYQVENVNFSPNSGMLSVSNDGGYVNLFRLGHFRNY